MTTSGTTTFNMDIDEIIDEALDMIGGEADLGKEPKSARRSLNLILTDWQNRGILLWKTGLGTQTVSNGVASYDLDSSIIDITEATLRRNGNDIEMTRISMEEYEELPNKSTSGRAIQYAVHRKRDNITVYLWPVPDNSTDIFRYWNVSRYEDFTKSVDTADVPFRFLPCLIYGLAYHMAIKRPGVPGDRIQFLKQIYEEALMNAMEEDRERASFRAVPYLRVV
jgi:hypothetical protein